MNKFVFLALIGANASSVNIPTISWNTTATDAAGANAQAWVGRNQAATAADNQASADDFTRAWARYEVGSYVNFGKTFAPIVAQEAEFLQKITPAGTCNQVAATNCLNTFYHSDMHGTAKAALNTCLTTTTNCNSSWDDMSESDRQAFATRYNTNVQNAQRAYDSLWNTFMTNMHTAQEAHETR